MQITLNQDEILEALDQYVRSQINIAESSTIEFDLKAGRGDNGYTATLDIVPAKKKKGPPSGPVYRNSVTRTIAETQQSVSDPVRQKEADEAKVEEETPATAETESASETTGETTDEAASEAVAETKPAAKAGSIFNFAKTS